MRDLLLVVSVLLLVLGLLRLLVVGFGFGVFGVVLLLLLRRRRDAGVGLGVHVDCFAGGGEAAVVFCATEVFAVFVEDDGGDDKGADEDEAWKRLVVCIEGERGMLQAEEGHCEEELDDPAVGNADGVVSVSVQVAVCSEEPTVPDASHGNEPEDEKDGIGDDDGKGEEKVAEEKEEVDAHIDHREESGYKGHVCPPGCIISDVQKQRVAGCVLPDRNR